MSKRILLVHGRSMKPSPEALCRLWKAAIRVGLERDHPEAVEAFDAANKKMVYYGEISNEFLHKKRPDHYPDWKKPEFEQAQVEGREAALEKLKTYGRDDFNKEQYDKLPGRSRFKERFADLFSGISALLGVANTIIERVAPDMAEYWSDERRFGSRVRERMIGPMKDAFDSGDSICIIAHSLGTLITYDTLWKFSRYGEYRGALTGGTNYNDDGFKVDLLVTLGSPLGDMTVGRSIKGAGNEGKWRYPANIGRWVNLAAHDDFISHDERIADDFEAMVEHKLIDQPIEDHRVYNLSIVPSADRQTNATLSIAAIRQAITSASPAWCSGQGDDGDNQTSAIACRRAIVMIVLTCHFAPRGGWSARRSSSAMIALALSPFDRSSTMVPIASCSAAFSTSRLPSCASSKPYGMIPLIRSPLAFLCARASAVRWPMTSRSSWASAAIVVKKNRPIGVVVSMLSVMDTRFAPAFSSLSAMLMASRVERARRESEYTITAPCCVHAWSSAAVRPDRLSMVRPLRPSSLWMVNGSNPWSSAYASIFRRWLSRPTPPRACSSVDTLRYPTAPPFSMGCRFEPFLAIWTSCAVVDRSVDDRRPQDRAQSKRVRE